MHRARRSPVVIVLGLTALAFAIAAPAASADQSLFDFFGSTGSGAGQFGKKFEVVNAANTEIGAGGLAVNNTTGDIYVADRINNRIEQFDSDENFIRGWGVDVIPGGAVGTGTLTSGSKEVTTVITTSKAFIAGQVVSVSAGSGTLPAGTKITEVITGVGAASKLVLSKAATAAGSVTLTAAEGSGNVPQNEQQKVSISATGGSFKLTMATTSPTASVQTGAISYTTSLAASSVQTALEGLSNVGAGNVEVTGPASGPYTVEFKGTRFADTNVAPLTTTGSALTGAGAAIRVDTTVEGAGRFEKCTTATTCQAGTATGIAGGMGQPNSVAVKEDSGDVYVSETGNIRVDQFDSTGTPIRSWGGNVVESGPDNKPEVQSLQVTGTSGTFVLTFGPSGGKATTASGAGTTANGSNEITAVTSTGTGAYLVGEGISGAGIPAGTTITGVGVGTLLLSANAEASASGVALTANLPAGASAALVEQSLNALTSIGGSFGSVTVSGTSPYQVTFGGAGLANSDVGQITVNANGLGLAVGTVLPCTGGPIGGSTTLTYEWLRNAAPIGGATAVNYTTVAEDAGKSIQCKVKATGSEAATVKANTPPAVVSPFPAVAPPVPGTPTITGATPTVGATLTCAAGTWTPGAPNAPTFTYKWLRNGVEIGGATSTTYVLQAADNQTAIQCEVTGTNGGGIAVADSARTVIRSEPPFNTGVAGTAPVISNVTHPGVTPILSDVLSCSNGTWTSGSPTFTYKWLRNGSEIASQTNSTYTVAAADAAAAIQCVVTATTTAGAGSAASANSVISPVPNPTPPIRPTAVISVGGTRNVGSTLTCSSGTWTPAPSTNFSFTYQWLRNGVAIAAPSATNTYVLQAADLDKQVQCQVVATNPSGSSAAISPATTGSGAVTIVNPPVATSSITSPSTASTVTNGGKAEICNAGSDVCRTGEGGTVGGIFGFNTINNIPFEGYLAISPAGPYAGDVFVADNVQKRIQMFTPNGVFVGTFGKATVAGTSFGEESHLCLSALNQICENQPISSTTGTGAGTAEKYGFSGDGFTQKRGDPPIRFVIDQTGAVYVINTTTLQKYSPNLLVEKDFAPKLCSLRPSAFENCTDVVADPESNDVYIAHGVPGQNESLETVLKEMVIVKVDSEGNYDPEHNVFPIETALTGAEVKPINGLAVDGSTGNERSGRVYLTTATPEQQVDVLGEPTPPDVAIDPIDPEAIEPHSATVNGTINPNGNKLHTAYRFETVTQGGIWTKFPIPNVDIGNGTAPVAVKETIPSLRANTTYKVRLTAFKGGQYTSPEESFTTPPIGPDIETGTAQWSGPPAPSPSLTFSGSVDDNNLPVHYYFEYGTNTSYGNRVPFFETGTHPGAQEAFTARETVNGLDPAGAYHYRLVARTSSGTAVGLDREVGPATAEGRFPELVSPVDKGVGTVGEFVNLAVLDQRVYQAADSGNKVAYVYEYGDKQATAGGDIYYLGTRNASVGSWQNSQLTPPSSGTAAKGDSVSSAAPGRVKWQSSDLSCAIIAARGMLTPDTPNVDNVKYLYRRDAAGNFTRMTPTPIDLATWYMEIANATPNCDRVVFETNGRLLPGLPNVGDDFGGTTYVYEWESSGGPNGTLRVASVLPDGSVPAKSLYYGGTNRFAENQNAAGGPELSRVFFSATSTEGGDVGKIAVFVRKNHAVTVDVSQSQTATPNDSKSSYEIASKDGSHVFFLARRGIAANGSSSAGPTTCGTRGAVSPGLGCDLYDYNVDTGLLRDLTPDTNAADVQGAYVVGTYGVSDDGTYAYFAAKGQLVPGQGRTFAENSPNGANIYLSHGGTLSFVGTLAGNDAGSASAFVAEDAGNFGSTRVTPDGRFLLFQSKRNLTSYNSGGVPELYLYSVAGTSVVCISCRTDAQPPHGLHERMLPTATLATTRNYIQRAISDDGSRIFFNSEDKLTPNAIEGTSESRSAYEWHDGVIRLLAAHGRIADSTPDGSNVFVLTPEALVPQDQDSAPDLYDFRLGGGFPYFPLQPCDPLTENSCQGTPPAPPAATADPASSTFTGPVNPAVPPVKAKHPKKPHKKHGKHHKKSHKRATKHDGGGSK